MDDFDIDVERMDHHGVVMGVIKDLGLIDIVNQSLGTYGDEKRSVGERIAAMIINGLGFTDQPLYLVSEFLNELPIETLFGEGVSASDFDRFSLARALDRISEYGEERLFSEVAAKACEKAGVDCRNQSFDTTSFSVTGQYETEDEAKIVITHGYSKDHRPDLKQIVTELLVSHDGGIPLVMKNWDGNASDNEIFKQRTERLVESFISGYANHVTADSKFYTEENSAYWDIVKFTTRVPETIKLARDLIQEAGKREDWTDASDNKAQFIKYEVVHYNTKQRWLVCRSKDSMARAKQSVLKTVEREKSEIEKGLYHFKTKRFSCNKDAEAALLQLCKRWKYHSVTSCELVEHPRYNKRGRPGDTPPDYIEYQIICHFDKCEDKIRSAEIKKGSFVIATNADESEVEDKDVLPNYKNQQNVERGYRFLKDPLFFTSAFYLKKPERLSALIMVMTLSLLVYSITQKRLRQAMKENEETLPNQIGQQVRDLTIRRAFQVLRGINAVKVSKNGIIKKFIQGVTEIKNKIICLIGGHSLGFYDLNTT